MDYSKIKATWWNCTCYHLEQLNAIISSTDIRCYAYILHDKDKQPNSEELKKPHYHFLVQFYTNQRGAWFKKFASDDMGFVFAQPCYHPLGAFNYLTHHTPSAIKQGKHRYDDSEVTSTIDSFECEDKPDEHMELYMDILDLLDNKISWNEFIRKKPKRIHMVGNIKIACELLSRRGKFDNTFRKLEVTYIFGGTEKGKTRYVMEKYGYKNVFRVTKNDPKTGHTAFDGYRGQDVIVFEEFRSSFKIEEMLNYLDGYPLMLPSRYFDKEAAYTKVYIVTNWSLEQQYKNIQTEHPSTWKAFNRRIHNIYNFDGNREHNLKGRPQQNEMRVLTPEEAEGLPW